MKLSRHWPAALLLAIALAPAPSLAQATNQDELGQMIDELRTLLDKGERERLADPWFLRDLRAVVDRYDWPWRKRLLSDDFSTRGPQPAKPWVVTAGEFLIDWRHGLRSVVQPPAPSQASGQAGSQQGGQMSSQDAAKALFGSILQQALGQGQQQQQGQQQGSGQTAGAPPDPGFAAVVAPIRISNAFAIKVSLSERPVDRLSLGRLELGPYQGQAAQAGYRLVYSPTAAPGTPSLELIRVSGRGTSSTLELTDAKLGLGDGAVHELLWTRDRGGQMVVSLDGKALFTVTDRSFRDPFDGFSVVNAGGDYALRQVVIDGTE